MKCRKEGIEAKDASVHPRITVRAVFAAWSHTGVNTQLRQEDVLKKCWEAKYQSGNKRQLAKKKKY